MVNYSLLYALKRVKSNLLCVKGNLRRVKLNLRNINTKNCQVISGGVNLFIVWQKPSGVVQLSEIDCVGWVTGHVGTETG